MRLVVAVVGLAAAVLVAAGAAREAAAACDATTAHQDAGPRWSPEMERIAFYRLEPGCDPAPSSIYVVRTDGTGLRRVGTGKPGASASPPSWSPAGLLAFAGATGIFVTEGGGRGLDQVTQSHLDSDPVFAPDGGRVAFRRGDELWVVRTNGAEPRRLAERLHDHAAPEWSPDGREIAVAAYRGPSTDVVVVDVTTGAERVVAPSDRNEYEPVWSGDGTQLAFVSERDGTKTVYRVRRDGSQIVRLTSGETGVEEHPAWGPHVGDLAVVASGTRRNEIRVLDLNGRTLRVIASRAGENFLDPAWRPDGFYLAYAAGRVCDRYGIYIGLRRITNQCIFRGTRGADTLRASPFRDLLYGFGGADRLVALGGDDFLAGYSGRDRLEGGAGADTLVGGAHSDLVLGGSGDDRVVPGGGRDRVFSGAGNDRIFARDGELDAVDCGLGRDDAIVDRVDVVRHCERVSGGRNRRGGSCCSPGEYGRFFDPKQARSDARGRERGHDESARRVLTAAGAGASFPGRNGLIVFHRGAAYGSNSELWTMRPDGTKLRRLTRNRVHEFSPAWSPDGSRIAFVRSRLVYVMNADGSGARPVTRLRGTWHDPAWSPDGSLLVVGRMGAPLDGLWTMTPSGARVRRLTSHLLDYAPAWSPDGRTIAFGRAGEIYAMSADGGDVRLLAGGKRHPPELVIETVRSGPRWAPDGTAIAFVEFSECCLDKRPRDVEIRVLARDGVQLRALPSRVGGDVAWSPDGRLLIQGDLEFIRAGTVVSDAATGAMLASLRVGGEAPDWQPLCGDNLVCGTPRRDRLAGGARIFGRGGDDRIDAVDGKFDVIGCGSGRDTVRADAGDLVGVDCENVRRF